MPRFDPNAPPHRRRRRARAAARAAALGLAALALACDVPTAPPRVETTFAFPGEPTTLAVAELLPGAVSASPAGGAFQLDIDGLSFARTLAELCEACAALHGAIVPKPAFTATFGDALALPADVVSVDLSGGSVELRLTHDFGFDPLRPGGGARGELTATLTSGGVVLGAVTVRGEDADFPSGATLTRTVALAAREVRGPIEVEITLVSPAGDPVRVDADAAFATVVEPGPLTVTRARVRVGERTLALEAATLDTEDVDASLVERVRGGAIVLDVHNPWQVAGTLTLRLDGVTKTVELAPGTTTRRVDLTEAEMRQILGRVVTLTAEGTLAGTEDVVTLTPEQRLVVETTLSLVVELGGGE